MQVEPQPYALAILDGRPAPTTPPEADLLWAELRGQPIIAHALTTLTQSRLIHKIVVVIHNNRANALATMVNALSLSPPHVSIILADHNPPNFAQILRNCPQLPGVVVLHAAEWFGVTPVAVDAAIQLANTAGLAVAGVAVKETMKVADAQGVVIATPARSELITLQPPFAMRVDRLAAFSQTNTIDQSWQAALVSFMAAHQAGIMPGAYTIFPIRTEADLALARTLVP